MTDYKVRCLRKSELEEMIALTSTAYNADLETFRRIYQHDPFYDFRLTRVADLDRKLIAYLRAAPRTIWIGSSKLKMGGIAEVCTLQPYRRMGIATHLLKDMIHLMIRKGFPVSMLYGRDTFYRIVGYERAMIVHWLRTPTKILPGYVEAENVREFEPGDLRAVMSAYDRTYARRSCTMVRNELHWKVRILGRSKVTVYDEDGVHGYLAYNLREEKADDASRRILYIEEAGYDGPRALRGLIGNLGRFQDCESVVYGGPPHDGLLSALSLPGSSLSVGWSGMFRVNDVASTLESLRDGLTGFQGRLALKVRDDIVEGNNGTFGIDGSGGEVAVERGGTGRKCEWLGVDIRELSQIIPGTLPVGQLASLGKLEFSSTRALDLAGRLFPPRCPLQPSLDHF